MDKQKIILPVVVILIFAAMIFIGLRSLPNTGQPSELGNIASPSWQSPLNPTQSPPINGEEVPPEAIKLGISSEGIIPAAFEVQEGAEVLLSITSEDEWSHIFRFNDVSLDNIAVGVGPEQARMIKFYAPEESGQYEFFCDVPGHKSRGEKGIMTVK